MTLEKIETDHLMRLWLESTPSEGWGYMVRMLRTHNCHTSKKQVKQAVYDRLVLVGIFDPNHDQTPRDWKRARLEWENTNDEILN